MSRGDSFSLPPLTAYRAIRSPTLWSRLTFLSSVCTTAGRPGFMASTFESGNLIALTLPLACLPGT